MKISTTEEGLLKLQEVFIGILLSSEKEELIILERDGIFNIDKHEKFEAQEEVTEEKRVEDSSENAASRDGSRLNDSDRGLKTNHVEDGSKKADYRNKEELYSEGGYMIPKPPNLLQDAYDEIVRLRRQIELLSARTSMFDNMMRLIEMYPQHPGLCASHDVAYDLKQAINQKKKSD